MEKILLAVDAVNPKKNALDFACYLARLTKSRVTGVFLENQLAAEAPVLSQVHGAVYSDEEEHELPGDYSTKMKLISSNIAAFREGCINQEVNFNVRRHRGFPANDLIKESRFADVLVVDAETSFHNRYEGTPTDFVHEILINAECPVIIAPESFSGIDEIIFIYNGSTSSLFAIKQFTYLFSQLFNKKVCVVQMNEPDEWNDQDTAKLKEWLNAHYYAVDFQSLHEETESGLISYLLNKKNIFLVMGAYEHFPLAHYFKNRNADLLIQTIMKPIFIAHL
ncbi:MAG: universal stress protein [Ferruginibacter sp.]|nr:universal stress protein [Ferruginibacter sp.]